MIYYVAVIQMSKTHGTYKSLRAWRDAHGLTLQQASEMLGLSLPGYHKIECGQRLPRRETLKRLRKKTGVPLEALTGVA